MMDVFTEDTEICTSAPQTRMILIQCVIKNRRPRWKRGLRLYRENLENMDEEKTTAGVKKKKS